MRFRSLQRPINYFRSHGYRRLKLIFGKTLFHQSLTIVFALIIITLPLTLIKFWPAIPPHVPARQRMSVLDWFQARALAQHARRLEGEIPLEQSRHWWRSAIGNHPGNVELNRDYLTILVKYDSFKEYWSDARNTAFWLLLINQTNTADLLLTSQVLEHYHADDYLLQTLANIDATNKPELRSIYLKALFRAGRYAEFQELLATIKPDKVSDPSFSLYLIAHQALKTNAPTAAAALAKLTALSESDDQDSLATRLQMQVQYQLGDLPGATASFNALTQRFDDRPSDHFRHWELLTKNGRLAEARQEAEAFIPTPRTGKDVLATADAYLKLGLNEFGLRFLQYYAHQFGFHESVWRTQADLLESQSDWRAIQRLAIDIRQASGVTTPFIAYSYFLDGLASLELDQEAAAIQYFQKISNYSVNNTELALYIGLELWEKGIYDIAETILAVESENYPNSLTYWQVRSDIAKKLNSPTKRLLTARKLYELQPENVQQGAQYAALLLSERNFTDLAMTLTYRALLATPQDIMLTH